MRYSALVLHVGEWKTWFALRSFFRHTLLAHTSDRRRPEIMKTRSIEYNVFMNMVLTSSKLIFPLLTVPYAARVLSTYGTGAVAFAQSVASYFGLAAVLGMTNYGITTCAKVRDNPAELSATVRELMSILAVSTILSTVVYLCSCLTVPRLVENRSLFLLFGCTILLTSMGVEWLYQALEQYTYITIRSIVFKFLGLALMFLLVRERSDYFAYGVIVIISGYLSNVLNMVRLRRYISTPPERRINPRSHLAPMAWYSIAAVSSGMYTQADIVLLGFLGTTDMVGLYQLVSKIKSLAVTAMNSVGNVLLPRLSYYTSKDRETDANRLIGKNVNFVVIVASAWIAFCLLCAKPVILILGGSDFSEAAVPLVLASPSVAFSALNIAFAGYLMSHSREREWAIINVTGLILAAIYNSVLIPRFGVQGSAVGVTLTELSVLILRASRCKGLVKEVWRQTEVHKVLLSICLAYAVSLLASMLFSEMGPIQQTLVQGAVLCITYILALLLLKEKFVMSYYLRVAGKRHAHSTHERGSVK